MDDLISRKAVRLALSEVDMPKSVIETEFYDVMSNVADRLIAVPSVPAVPLDELCELLATNADCPPEHNPIVDHCIENKCAECWKTVLKEWVEEI